MQTLIQLNVDSQSDYMLDALDPALGSVRTSWPLEEKLVDQIILLESKREVDRGIFLPLSDENIVIVEDYLERTLPDGHLGVLRRKHWVDELPYRVHTNGELILMLEGKKPLAAFAFVADEREMDWAPSCYFEPFVKKDSILIREYCEYPRTAHVTMVVLYARPGEEWRLDAYISMLFAARAAGWSDGFERLQGMLLGYEEWQTESFLVARDRRLRERDSTARFN